MGIEDGIKIGVSLLITVALIAITVTYTNKYSKDVYSKTMSVEGLVTEASLGPIKSANGSLKPGNDTLDLIKYYSKYTPILIVTAELQNSGAGYSYRTEKCHDPINAEYINPNLKYRIDARYSTADGVQWIRIVQSTLVNQPNLPTVESTATEYLAIQNHLDSYNKLIDDQYLMNKNNLY